MTAQDKLAVPLFNGLRVAWVSGAAQSVWQPRVERIRRASTEVAWQTVAADIRQGALFPAGTIEDPVEAAARWVRAGLACFPVSSGDCDGGSSEVPEPFVLVARAENAQHLLGAWQSRDSGAIAALLGYPPCCSRGSPGRGARSMADASPAALERLQASHGRSRIRSSNNMDIQWTNILLEGLGATMLWHLPCGWDCQASQRVGGRHAALGRSLGLHKEIGWMAEMQNWPIEWSSLHGIAEVRTPVMKFLYPVPATDAKVMVTFDGSNVPPEAAVGLDFMYQQRNRERAVTGVIQSAKALVRR